MSTDRRIGLAGVIVGFFSIAAFYIWPNQKWIGWSALGVAIAFCLMWFVLEVIHWANRIALKKKTSQPLTAHDFFDVELTPSSGPSHTMFLAVRNKGQKQKFHATCTVVARRNDPNPLHKRTYDLVWDRDSAREAALVQGESSNLVIATADADYQTKLEEAFLVGLVDGKRDTMEYSRWTIRDRFNPPPEYDLDVSIFSDEVGLVKKETFVLKCGGRTSALEMFPLNADQDSEASASAQKRAEELSD